MARLHVNNLIEQKEADPFKKEADPFKKKEEDPFKKGSVDSGADTSLTGDDLNNGKVVKIGMRGDIVGKIQDLLIKLGYVNVSKDNKTDKIFGSRTQKMVKDFQTANGLNDDGEVGEKTWPKLNDPAAVKSSASSSTSSSSAVSSSNSGETEPGSDIIIKESLKKTLRKNLLKFN